MLQRKTLIILVGAAIGLAALVSPYASGLPDGLERVAADLGFVEREQSLLSSPVSDYSWRGIFDERLSTSTAGAMGTLAVFLVASLMARVLGGAKARRRYESPGN